MKDSEFSGCPCGPIGGPSEMWLGVDVVAPAHEPVVRALAGVSASGTVRDLMHGNRDFLLCKVVAYQLGAPPHCEDEHMMVFE